MVVSPAPRNRGQVIFGTHLLGDSLGNIARVIAVASEEALIWGNYLDFCNFPQIQNDVLPGLREQGENRLFPYWFPHNQDSKTSL
jgi:hypothetical protein